MPENCPNCESSRTNYVSTYGFWECDDCGHVWGHDADDPDYDELNDDFNYDGDTGRAFINGRWVVVSPRTNQRWNEGSN